MTNLIDEKINNSANKLVGYYDSDLVIYLMVLHLAGQILPFRSCAKEEIAKRTPVKAITQLRVIQKFTIATTYFFEICTACTFYF